MREIKFRGKRVDNGELVNGYYLPWHAVRTLDDKEPYAQIYDERSKDWILVYAETVGQYTGLKDKNDVEIYEGDLIKTAYASGIFVVAFDERYTCVSLFEVKQLSDKYICLSNRFQYDYEVIGNIYDNPELLEETI